MVGSVDHIFLHDSSSWVEIRLLAENQLPANNAEVEVWFVQPELNSLEPNFFLIPTADGQKTDRKGQVLSRVPRLKTYI